MTIIYVFSYTDPHQMGRALPPSVDNSEQVKKLHNAIKNNASTVDIGNGGVVLFFESIEEIRAWFDEYRITDPALLADIEMWNKAYGIVHHHTFYTANELKLEINPVF